MCFPKRVFILVHGKGHEPGVHGLGLLHLNLIVLTTYTGSDSVQPKDLKGYKAAQA